jgi:hypothetical protein
VTWEDETSVEKEPRREENRRNIVMWEENRRMVARIAGKSNFIRKSHNNTSN